MLGPQVLESKTLKKKKIKQPFYEKNVHYYLLHGTPFGKRAHSF